MDMFAMALRGMGIDPDVVMTQAAGIGKAFERLLSGQAVMMAKLDAIEFEPACDHGGAWLAAAGTGRGHPTADRSGKRASHRHLDGPDVSERAAETAEAVEEAISDAEAEAEAEAAERAEAAAEVATEAAEVATEAAAETAADVASAEGSAAWATQQITTQSAALAVLDAKIDGLQSALNLLLLSTRQREPEPEQTPEPLEPEPATTPAEPIAPNGEPHTEPTEDSPAEVKEHRRHRPRI